MTTSPRPLTTRAVAGQVLDDGFARWRRNFKTLTLVTLILQLPTTLFSFFYSLDGIIEITDNGLYLVEDPAAYNRTQGWIIALSTFASVLAFAVSTNVVYQDWRGRRMAPLQAIRESSSRFFPFLGMLILIGLMYIVGAFAMGIAGVFGVPGFIIGFLGLYAFFAPLAQTPAVFWAGSRAAQSIGRSFELTRGRFWKVLGVVTVGIIVVGIFRLGATAPFFAALTSQSILLHLGVGAVVSLASEVIGMPLLAALSVSLYFDGIVSKEGFDIKEMIRALPPVMPVSPPPPPPTAAPPPPPRPPAAPGSPATPRPLPPDQAPPSGRPWH